MTNDYFLRAFVYLYIIPRSQKDIEMMIIQSYMTTVNYNLFIDHVSLIKRTSDNSNILGKRIVIIIMY